MSGAFVALLQSLVAVVAICFLPAESGMGPVPVFVFEQLTTRNASPCVCRPHVVLLFDLIAALLSLLLHFYTAVWRIHSLFLSLSSYLGCLALLIWLPFVRSLLRRIFFLPHAYYMRLPFVFLFSPLSPFLATVSFAGLFR